MKLLLAHQHTKSYDKQGLYKVPSLSSFCERLPALINLNNVIVSTMIVVVLFLSKYFSSLLQAIISTPIFSY